MSDVNFAALNEELIQIVEKNIDPKFRDALKRVETDRKSMLNKAADKYKDDDGYYGQQIKRRLKNSEPVRKIYQELAKGGLDVEQASIEFIGTGEELNAKNLKQILKDKMDKEDYNNGPNRVFLIMDKHYEPGMWDEENRTGFGVWEAYYRDGKFFLDDYVRNSSFQAYAKGRILMADLNAKNKWLADKDFYIAYGKSNADKRNERTANKVPASQKRYPVGRWDDHLDKSGYDLKDARNALQMRLKDYKKNSGTYTKQVEELTAQLDELLPKVNEILSNIDFNQGIDLPKKVMEAARRAAVEINDIAKAEDSTWYDDSSMKNRIFDAKVALAKLRELL